LGDLELAHPEALGEPNVVTAHVEGPRGNPGKVGRGRHIGGKVAGVGGTERAGEVVGYEPDARVGGVVTCPIGPDVPHEFLARARGDQARVAAQRAHGDAIARAVVGGGFDEDIDTAQAVRVDQVVGDVHVKAAGALDGDEVGDDGQDRLGAGQARLRRREQEREEEQESHGFHNVGFVLGFWIAPLPAVPRRTALILIGCETNFRKITPRSLFLW
jgi:hypothetical protein